jgi:hypothetical protein
MIILKTKIIIKLIILKQKEIKKVMIKIKIFKTLFKNYNKNNKKIFKRDKKFQHQI